MKALTGEAAQKFRLGVRQHRAVLDFVTAIEDEMRERAILPSELAVRLGKSRSWISKIFRTKPNLTFFTAVEIADALKLDFNAGLRSRGSSAALVSAPSHAAVIDSAEPSLQMRGSAAKVVHVQSSGGSLRRARRQR